MNRGKAPYFQKCKRTQLGGNCRVREDAFKLGISLKVEASRVSREDSVQQAVVQRRLILNSESG